MKTLKFKTAILLGVFLSASSIPLIAMQDVNKEFHEEYDANAQTRLILDNKYGNIDIKDWDQQKVKVDIVVRVNHSIPEKAEKALEYINVIFSTNGNEITVTTEIDSKFNRSNWGNDNEFEINYSVQMPKEVNLSLHNKYGNVFISELAGEAIIDVNYGKLTVNKLSRGNEKPLQSVDLAYANGCSISEADWLKANIKYSNLTIDKATAIVAYSKYSKLFVDEASSIVLEGKYDGYGFGKLANLVINTSYSGLKVEELNDKFAIISAYTDVKIEHMPASFESIDINSKYGTVRVGLDESASYKLDGEASYSKIFFHDTGRVSKVQENNAMNVSGTVGTNANPSAVVKVITRYGNVKLDY